VLPPSLGAFEPNLPEYCLPEPLAAESRSLYGNFLLCLELFKYRNLLP